MDRSCAGPDRARRGFPRRRGDGPWAGDDGYGGALFPPQARGWTSTNDYHPGSLIVSPAGAGMDRHARHRPRCRPGFPRRRGDGPCSPTASRSACSFPPQARGWTPSPLHLHPSGPVSPAGAGMDRDSAAARCRCRRFPRRRGDGPIEKVSGKRRQRFPPQARGWTRLASRPRPAIEISPAGAGMDRLGRLVPLPAASFPRRRGDGPLAVMSVARPSKFPPQARGWTAAASAEIVFPVVSPAGAGMDLDGRTRRRNPASFPRRRGDGPPKPAPSPAKKRFPPQARGWTSPGGGTTTTATVSPAGAGMDPSCGRRQVLSIRFPRRRGDGPRPAVYQDGTRWFPPQARGWTLLEGGQPVAVRVSPAGAGMDPRAR